MKKTLAFGHRGAMSIAPENTLASFRTAQQLGADGIEFDVQFSADRQLVVIHDLELGRTTDGTGPVAHHTLAQLRQLDAGVRFDACFAGERIPTLQDVFDMPGSPLQWNIELKLERGIREDTGLERAVIESVRRNAVESRVLISSFNFFALRRVRQLAPDLRLGVLFRVGVDESEYAELSPEALHPHVSLVDEALVRRARARGQQVNVWTVNEESDMRTMIALGVDIIMTNFPQRLVPLLAGNPSFAP